MIYSPIWVDQFSPRNRKTLFMAVQQVASPLGVVLGYALTFGLKQAIAVDGWGYSYIVQCILLLALAIGLSFVDDLYFMTNIRLANEEKIIEVIPVTNEEGIVEGEDEEKKEKEEREKRLKEETSEEKKKREEEEEIKRKEELTPEGSYDEDDISIYYDFTDEDTAEIPSFFNHMKEIFQYKVK